MQAKGYKTGHLADQVHPPDNIDKMVHRAKVKAENETIKADLLAKHTLDMNQTWDALMWYRNKETRTNGIANTLTEDEIETIIANMEFFGASPLMLRQIYSDLRVARFRLFDCLAMNIDALRNVKAGNRSENADLESGREPLRVLAHSYLKSKGNINKFIEDLRETDYDVDKSYERIDFGEKSQNDFARLPDGKISDTELSPYGRRQLELLDNTQIYFTDGMLTLKDGKLIDSSGKVFRVVDNDRLVNKLIYKII
jgi:hypothetical protein